MADTDTITLTRTEYEDLVDARDHALAIRDIASGAAGTLTSAEVDAWLAAASPLAFWRRSRRGSASGSHRWLRPKPAGFG